MTVARARHGEVLVERIEASMAPEEVALGWPRTRRDRADRPQLPGRPVGRPAVAGVHHRGAGRADRGGVRHPRRPAGRDVPGSRGLARARRPTLALGAGDGGGRGGAADRGRGAQVVADCRGQPRPATSRPAITTDLLRTGHDWTSRATSARERPTPVRPLQSGRRWPLAGGRHCDSLTTTAAPPRPGGREPGPGRPDLPSAVGAPGCRRTRRAAAGERMPR